MPSKKYNGNSPLGGSKIDGFADAELQIARRTPLQALSTGIVQTPNGAIHTPKRRRRSKAGTSSHPWKVSVITNEDNTRTATIITSQLLDLSDKNPSWLSLGSTSKDVPDGNCYVFLYRTSAGTWSSFPQVATSEDYSATTDATDWGNFYKYPLAYISSSSEIKQVALGHLAVIESCVNGKIGNQIIGA
jgi:hypothetical protein